MTYKLGSTERHSQKSGTLLLAALQVDKQVPSQHVGACCSHRQRPTAVEPSSTLLTGWSICRQMLDVGNDTAPAHGVANVAQL